MGSMLYRSVRKISPWARIEAQTSALSCKSVSETGMLLLLSCAENNIFWDTDTTVTALYRFLILLIFYSVSVLSYAYCISYYYYRLLRHKSIIKHIHRQSIDTAYREALKHKIIKSH